MYVYNCKVRRDQRIRSKAARAQSDDAGPVVRGHSQASQDSDGDDDVEEEDEQAQPDPLVEQDEEMIEEIFTPVECLTCGTEVGLVDTNEVYHFFHVLESSG
mmetsp:Transcript_8895/g.32803  ORF Transcript_8895/g.32803 Transcript_8895/m.32803 type:complete len:102 (+) Transcript_8895:378-683(+)